MRIDFHTHGKLAKKLPFSSDYTDWLFGEAKSAGLTALCLTEHFNTLGFEEVYGYISSAYEKDGDTFLVDGLRIFSGMETDILEGGHILSIGTMKDILELNKRLEPYKEKGKFLPAKELFGLFGEYDVLVGAGHPFREGGHIPELPNDILRRFDFFDLNGKDLATNRDMTIKMTYDFGRKYGKPVVSGSDTHQAFQYGCVSTVFEEECHTVSDLRKAMEQENYKIEFSDYLSFQVKTASVLKKALKQIHGLGGDYVSVLTMTGE